MTRWLGVSLGPALVARPASETAMQMPIPSEYVGKMFKGRSVRGSPWRRWHLAAALTWQDEEARQQVVTHLHNAVLHRGFRSRRSCLSLGQRIAAVTMDRRPMGSALVFPVRVASCPRCPAGACRSALSQDDKTTMPSITPQDTAIIEGAGGVDTHSDTHTAAVIDMVGRVLGTEQFLAEPQPPPQPPRSHPGRRPAAISSSPPRSPTWTSSWTPSWPPSAPTWSPPRGRHRRRRPAPGHRRRKPRPAPLRGRIHHAVRRRAHPRLQRQDQPPLQSWRRPASQRRPLPRRPMPSAMGPPHPRLHGTTHQRRLSKKEIIRCLKRYIARELYQIITTNDLEPVA